jgi:uncharacterized membrane protein
MIGLTVAAALGSGLVAGIFFAFSSFIMPALRQRPAAEGIAAMQSINRTVITPSFMAVFLGTPLIAGGLAVYGGLDLEAPGAFASLVGGLLAVLGCFVVTIAANVPLNDALAAVDAESAEGARIWEHYRRRWTTWNTVRTAGSLLAAVAFTLAVTARA